MVNPFGLRNKLGGQSTLVLMRMGPIKDRLILSEK